MKFILLLCLGAVEFCIPQPIAEFPSKEECFLAGVQVFEQLQEESTQGIVVCEEKQKVGWDS